MYLSPMDLTNWRMQHYLYGTVTAGRTDATESAVCHSQR